MQRLEPAMKPPFLRMLFAALLAAVTTGLLAPQPVCAQTADPKNASGVYGLIEVGSSGVKPLIVSWEPGTTEPGTLHVVRELEPRDVKPSDPVAFERTVATVAALTGEMEKTHGIPRERIHVVGSSGVGNLSHSAGLAVKVKEATGIPMSYVTAAEETRFTFRGIVPPSSYDSVVVIDIGSGNTKAAFYFEQDGEGNLQTGEITSGSSLLARAIEAQAPGDPEFGEALAEYASSVVMNDVRTAAVNAGFVSQPRVYLSGGVVWAMASSLHPETAETKELQFTRLAGEDIEKWAREVIADPRRAYQYRELPGMTEEDKANAADTMARVRKIFSPRQMQAGATIILCLHQGWDFRHRERIYFAKRALYAWPRGYLAAKLEPGAARPRVRGVTGPVEDTLRD